MPRFYSIPGCRPHQRDSDPTPPKELPPHLRSWLDARKSRPPTATGFVAGDTTVGGDTITIDGKPAVIEGEEVNKHDGTVELWAHSIDGTTTRRVRWERVDDPHYPTMVLTESKRAF